jgi:hypothetical protein
MGPSDTIQVSRVFSLVGQKAEAQPDIQSFDSQEDKLYWAKS